MVVPEICCHSRTEDSCGIHRRPGERPPKQDVESNCRSNNQTGNPPWPTFIHGSAMHYEDEKVRENSFHQNPLPRREINGELRGASHNNLASEQTEANQRGRDSAKQLRDPVTKRVRPLHMAATNEA